MVKISIITPTFNSAATISGCVKSILNQKYEKFEHIIVDNVSSDNTIEIIEKLYSEAGCSDRLKLSVGKDNGISEAFNKGIALASGDVIGILNSDDSLYNEIVLNEIAEAFNDENILFTHGDIMFIDPKYGSSIRYPRLSLNSLVFYQHPTMYFRKEVYSSYGVYDTSFRCAMDVDFMLRLKRLLPDIENQSRYLNKFPLAIMRAGGVSWAQENIAADELKRALSINGFLNASTLCAVCLRKIRIRTKTLLSKFGLEHFVAYWRKWKWKSQD